MELIEKLNENFDVALIDNAERNKKGPVEFKKLIEKIIKDAKPTLIENFEKTERKNALVARYTPEHIYKLAYSAAWKRFYA